jgi:hypothetical protein
VAVDLPALGLAPGPGVSLDAEVLHAPQLPAGSMPKVDADAGTIGGFDLGRRKWTLVAFRRYPTQPSCPVVTAREDWAGADQEPRAELYWQWGLARPDVRDLGDGSQGDLARSDDGDVRLRLWRRDDRVLLLVHNAGQADKTCGVRLDMVKLGLMPIKPWASKIGFQRIEGSQEGGEPAFDVHTGAISGLRLPANGWATFSIRMYP